MIVTRSIVGLKREESDVLLNFLLAHVSRGIDYQSRIRWAPKTVVVWDVSFCIHSLDFPPLTYEQNRVTAHSAVVDWITGERRHLARITPQAERPFETPYVKQEEGEKH